MRHHFDRLSQTMKKKSQLAISFITLCLISGSTFADLLYPIKLICTPRQVCKVLYDGFYVGVSAGYDAYQIRENSGLPLDAHPTVDTQGPSGSLIGGYGQYYAWFYIAGELSVTGSGAGASFNNVNVNFSHSNRINVRESFAASILTGARLTRTALFYVRVGVVRTLLNIDETEVIANVATHNLENEWIDGIRYGVGIETGIFNQVSLRAEFTRTNYGSEGSQMGTQLTPAQSQFMLAVLYHFC